MLRGGSGRDTMSGGRGADRFVFTMDEASGNSSSSDRILDFETGQDAIDLDIITAASGTGVYAEAMADSNSYRDTLAMPQSMIGGKTSVVFVAGQTDGWLFWSGSGMAGQVDQLATLSGASHSTSLEPGISSEIAQIRASSTGSG